MPRPQCLSLWFLYFLCFLLFFVPWQFSLIVLTTSPATMPRTPCPASAKLSNIPLPQRGLQPLVPPLCQLLSHHEEPVRIAGGFSNRGWKCSQVIHSKLVPHLCLAIVLPDSCVSPQFEVATAIERLPVVRVAKMRTAKA